VCVRVCAVQSAIQKTHVLTAHQGGSERIIVMGLKNLQLTKCNLQRLRMGRALCLFLIAAKECHTSCY
jgi:hypothetical protein